MKLWELDELIKTVAPIYGVNSNGKIAFADEATEAQRQAAEALIQEYLPQLETSFPL